MDWGHPLAQGLISYAIDIGGQYVDIARNQGFTKFNSGAATAGVSTKFGQAISYVGATTSPMYGGLAALDTFYNTAPYSVATGIYFNGANVASDPNIFGVGTSTGTTPAIIGYSIASNVFFYEYANGSNNNGSVTLSTNTYNTSVMVATTSSQGQCYANGNLDASPAVVTTMTQAGSVLNIHGFSTGSPNATTLTGSIYWGAIWKRALTQADALQLYLDPYCFLVFPEDDVWSLAKGTAAAVVIPGIAPAIAEPPLRVLPRESQAIYAPLGTMPTQFPAWRMPVIDPPLRVLPRESSAIFAAQAPTIAKPFWYAPPVDFPALKLLPKESTTQFEPQTIQQPVPHWRGPAIDAPMLRVLPKESIAQFSPQVPAIQYPFWYGPTIDPPLRSLPKESAVWQALSPPPVPVYWSASIADPALRVLPRESSVLIDPQVLSAAVATPSILGWYYQQPDVPRQVQKESSVQIDPQFIPAFVAPVLFGWYTLFPDPPPHPLPRDSVVQYEPQFIPTPLPQWAAPVAGEPMLRVLPRESFAQFSPQVPLVQYPFWYGPAIAAPPAPVLPRESSTQLQSVAPVIPILFGWYPTVTAAPALRPLLPESTTQFPAQTVAPPTPTPSAWWGSPVEGTAVRRTVAPDSGFVFLQSPVALILNPAYFHISEYSQVNFEAPDAVRRPALTVQVRIEFSDGNPHQSMAFSSDTKAIRMSTDTDVCVKVGGLNPVATLDDDLLPASNWEYRWVFPGDRLSVVKA